MAVHIRLARMGTNRTPFYRIVVADQRSPRGGRFIERIGTFDPRRAELRIEGARVQHWLQRGAQPSHTVSLLLKQAKVELVAPAAAAAAAPAAPAPAPAPVAAAAPAPKKDGGNKGGGNKGKPGNKKKG